MTAAHLAAGVRADALMAGREISPNIPGSAEDIYPDGLQYDRLTESQIAIAQLGSLIFIPEPRTMLLMSFGMFGLELRVRKTDHEYLPVPAHPTRFRLLPDSAD